MKTNTPKQQRINAELETIIEEFGRAMRNAHRPAIVYEPSCQHDSWVHFTLAMTAAWQKYVEFCRNHLNG